MKRTAFLACLLLLAAAPSPSGMVLTYEMFYNGPPGSETGNMPTWCYHEDSSHIRRWEGRLAPGESFDVALEMCPEYLEDGTHVGPGGAGIIYVAAFPERLSFNLRITFPDGTIRLAHTLQPGYVAGCVVPYVQEPNDVIRGSLASGIYHATFTNTSSRGLKPNEIVSEQIRVVMADLATQRSFCPLADQNIGPII